MVYQYEWKYKNYPVNPNVAGKELERLEKENGEVKAKDLVDSARDETSVMHPCFDWNDTTAAEKYRLIEANSIISHLVRVEVKNKDKTYEKEVRAYVNVNPKIGFGQEGKFISINNAMSDQETRKIVLRKALDELMTFKRKYQTLHELDSIFSEIQKTAENMKNAV